uniref:Uncharacterized protein n=1 Tax=Branchiostoma floridae TaxID=7739 RepID=C3YFE0_BRAFL|eukprot:XP_002604893.1 hypothetical protein BRAFLDRAFT_77274 [Branchiostoma floridae]
MLMAPRSLSLLIPWQLILCVVTVDQGLKCPPAKLYLQKRIVLTINCKTLDYHTITLRYFYRAGTISQCRARNCSPLSCSLVSDITKGQAWLDTYIGAQFRPVQLAPRVVGYFPKHQVAHPRPRTQGAYLHFSSPTQEDATVLHKNNDTCRCCSEPCRTIQEDDLNAWDDMHLKLLFGEEEEDGEGLVTSGSGRHDSLTDVESTDKTPVPDNITPVPDGAGALHRTSPWC